MNEEQKLLNIIHKATPLKIWLALANESIEALRLTDFYYKLELCLKSEAYIENIEMGPILICLNQNERGTGKNMLDPEQLGNYLRSGASRRNNVLTVDYEGIQIVNEDLMFGNPADAATHFCTNEIIIFFVSGNRLEIYYKAKIIECIPDIFSHNRAVIISDTTLPVSKYRELIKAHHKNKIHKKNILAYWKNKQKRLLVPAPENIFGKDLAYYLDRYVADGHVDTECYNAWTDDRTDIRILKDIDRSIYIIEVKWLGKSMSHGENITSYDVERANAGLVQLNEYLKAEPQSFCAALVIYDARTNDVEIQWDTKFFHDARMDAPIRFYLVSESASNKGDRIAREHGKAS